MTTNKTKIYTITKNTESAEHDNSLNTSNIKMPIVKKSKGRPKKRSNEQKFVNLPTFKKKKEDKKMLQIMRSLFGETRTEEAIDFDEKIEKHELPESSNAIPDCFHDKLMNLSDVKKYFQDDAYDKMMKMIGEKKAGGLSTCGECT